MVEDLRQDIVSPKDKPSTETHETEEEKEIRKQFKLSLNEYLENEGLIDFYSQKFKKDPKEVEEAIKTIFSSNFKKDLHRLSSDDYIRINEMVEQLKTYFDNNLK